MGFFLPLVLKAGRLSVRSPSSTHLAFLFKLLVFLLLLLGGSCVFFALLFLLWIVKELFLFKVILPLFLLALGNEPSSSSSKESKSSTVKSSSLSSVSSLSVAITFLLFFGCLNPFFPDLADPIRTLGFTTVLHPPSSSSSTSLLSLFSPYPLYPF
uniref:Uncharacterized protein n=1 Tax=Opuntia streptacantha TaxID=393608 RepID=A0A7C9CZ24_OPUST